MSGFFTVLDFINIWESIWFATKFINHSSILFIWICVFDIAVLYIYLSAVECDTYTVAVFSRTSLRLFCSIKAQLFMGSLKFECFAFYELKKELIKFKNIRPTISSSVKSVIQVTFISPSSRTALCKFLHILFMLCALWLGYHSLWIGSVDINGSAQYIRRMCCCFYEWTVKTKCLKRELQYNN